MRGRTVFLALGLALPLPLAAQKFEVMETTIAGVHAGFTSGKLTCRALVQAYLDRIAAYDKTGPALNAIQFVNPRALEQADSLDAVWRGKSPRGSLHCVPVLLKDQVETSTMPTTYGSALFKDFVPKRDATIVRRLQGAGAIILAKTTMGEFAARFVGSAFGIVRNAYDPTRNPSGSSGGSASGVAANFGLVGIGEDTGGSIRGPAAVSSLVGLRPTTPLVSRFGMMPANPSQDTMGPITRCVADAARVLDVIAGYDPEDPVTAETVGHVPASYLAALKPNALRGVRVGVIRTRRDSAVARAPEEFAKVRVVLEQALADLRKLGAEVVDSLVIPTLANVRVGNDFETEQATDAYLAQHPTAPVKTLKDILLAGTVNPWRARGLMDLVGKRTTDPGYLTVIQQRAGLRIAVLKAMADARLDAIVYATYDAPPTPIAEDVLTNSRTADAYGRGDNRGLSPTIGFPALTVPAGFTSDSLPVGLEFLGRPFAEAALLGYAFAYEQATKHRRPPKTTPGLTGGRSQ
ncbi:MAG TPA: amidase family protein [Gemmatimonadales bacterium]|nr:amidase family protein [Gemmatimonadales bacterium]